MKCFHHNDLDGKCAGSIVAQFTKNYNQEDYFELDYIKPLPIDKISENETVYLVDYSFTENTVWQLDEILKKTKNVVWCDHHISSLSLLVKRPDLKQIKGLVQDKISGAALTYMYLYDCDFGTVPYYIKLVSDYDCWIYDYDPDTTHFKIGMDMTDHNALNTIWQILYNEKDNHHNFLKELIDKGRIVKQYIDQDNTQYRKAWAYESELEGHKCLVINRKSNSWLFGDQYNKYPLVVSWVFNGESYVYSIFSSSKNIDCSKIAKKFGGGGHFSAAGFSSNELVVKKIKSNN